uniref:Coiled-coil domain containing 127 n=1 Tax=Ficedula albicollis TaxID=59894 RepID=A0A803V2H2_FICAL
MLLSSVSVFVLQYRDTPTPQVSEAAEQNSVYRDLPRWWSHSSNREWSFVSPRCGSTLCKYRDIITENRRAVAHLEVELEKERNRTLSYREALVSQSRKLVEERKLLEQQQEKLEQEKQVLLHSGAEGTLYQSCLAKEEEWQQRANILLKEFEEGLKERQDIYCSLIVPRSQRLEIEKNLLVKAATNPVAMALDMESGLKDIFKHDNYCGNVLNRTRSQNGKLMWLYLRYWELAVELQKFKRVEKAMLEKR